MKYWLHYYSIDGVHKKFGYDTLLGLRKKAVYWVGEHPTVSVMSGYAVSDDGVGKVVVVGCSITDVFPQD
jgi:hypothetical protein